jgi:hypothetical protein
MRRLGSAPALRRVVLAAVVVAGCGKVAPAAAPEMADAAGDPPPDATGMTDGPDGAPDADATAPDASACSNVDTTSDGNNCGACGHTCGGGACVASACQPVALATGQHTPIGLAVDATNIYWTTSDGNVMKAPISGGAATVLAAGQRSPWGIAVDAANVYWANAASLGQVMTVPIAGGEPTVLVDQQRRPVHLAVADGVLYWANQLAGTVMSVPVTGGTPTLLADKQGQLVAITVESRTLYWSSIGQGVIRSLPLGTGGTIATIADDQDAAALFVRDATVYWANVELVNDVASVFKLPAGGEPVALGSGPGPYAAVADAQHVYWTDETAGTVTKVPVGGGDATVIAKDQASVSELAIDGANLYWLNAGTDGAVMKLAK